MLLWLTLALLWSPTCWAGGKSGWGSRVQSIPLETTLPSHLPGPGVWASSCHRLTQLSDLSPCLEGLCLLLDRKKTCHCVFIFFSLPHLVLSLIALYGRGGGSYFSTTKDNENEITGIRVFIGIGGIIKR